RVGRRPLRLELQRAPHDAQPGPREPGRRRGRPARGVDPRLPHERPAARNGRPGEPVRPGIREVERCRAGPGPTGPHRLVERNAHEPDDRDTRMSRTQSARLLAIGTPLGDDVLLLRAIAGTEELGRPFHYDLDLLSEN